MEQGLILHNEAIITDLLTEKPKNRNYPWGPEFMFLMRNPFDVSDFICNDSFIQALNNLHG